MSMPPASSRIEPHETAPVTLTVNGQVVSVDVEPRRLLTDVLREDLALTGTHVGCEHGVCGCCTVLFDGRPARACLLLAIQADGHSVQTVESLAGPDGTLHPLQEAFRRCHGLQCGFCTPGQLMNALPFYRGAADMQDTEIRALLGGQLCRCTGYQSIVDAIRTAAEIEAARGDEGRA